MERTTHKLSITPEIEAIAAGVRTDMEGMEAFRLGGPAAVSAMEYLQDIEDPAIAEIIFVATCSSSQNPQAESLKKKRLDEFQMSVAINAYKAKKGLA